MPNEIPDYPWYVLVTGDEVEQGDIFTDCPVFLPPDDLPTELTPDTDLDAVFDWQTRDVVVISQTCDMVKGREKIKEVLLCPVYRRAEVTQSGQLAKSGALEAARLGRIPAFQVIDASMIEGHKEDVRFVDFASVHSFPLSFVRRLAAARDHLRILPPYREHLSQGFARFFMRVGLPVDIPRLK